LSAQAYRLDGWEEGSATTDLLRRLNKMQQQQQQALLQALLLPVLHCCVRGHLGAAVVQLLLLLPGLGSRCSSDLSLYQ
jgi:hypothetical protein